MSPAFKAGQIVWATGRFKNVRVGDTVVFAHNGLDKVKRVSQIDVHKGLFMLGDNATASTDSRSFGWIDFDEVIGKVIWPRR